MLAQIVQRTVVLVTILLMAVTQVGAQENVEDIESVVDSVLNAVDKAVEGIAIPEETDSMDQLLDAALQSDILLSRKDSIKLAKQLRKEERKRKWATWSPDPKRAMWLAMVIPGAGQIYNRKYWKLPIVYGGFVGCAYAMRWNDMMYSDYSRAYSDIMDDDPTTESYNQFLHLGNKITDANKARYQQVFKSRKDRYRRWRDMSFFCMIGVYALSIIDAYVDASLSQFDISNDLSLHVGPGLVNMTQRNGYGMPLNNTGFGVNCCLDF